MGGRLAGVRGEGVATASGARFSTRFQSAAPTAASAVAGRLGDGTAVILLDLSRSATVYAVINCSILVTRNPQGQQYTFDEAFTGFGSGAGCPIIGSNGRHLVGYLAKADDRNHTFTVTQTVVDIGQRGLRAANGAATRLGTGLAVSFSIVQQSHTVTCGAGGRAHEPASRCAVAGVLVLPLPLDRGVRPGLERVKAVLRTAASRSGPGAGDQAERSRSVRALTARVAVMPPSTAISAPWTSSARSDGSHAAR